MIIDNNNIVPDCTYTYTLMVNETVHQFSNITIINKGYLAVDGNDALNFTNLNLTVEGASDSYIFIVNSTGVSFPSEFNISSYTLFVDGLKSVTGNWGIKNNSKITASTPASL